MDTHGATWRRPLGECAAAARKKLLRAPARWLFRLILAYRRVCPSPSPSPRRRTDGERGSDSGRSRWGEGTGRRLLPTGHFGSLAATATETSSQGTPMGRDELRASACTYSRLRTRWLPRRGPRFSRTTMLRAFLRDPRDRLDWREAGRFTIRPSGRCLPAKVGLQVRIKPVRRPIRSASLRLREARAMNRGFRARSSSG